MTKQRGLAALLGVMMFGWASLTGYGQTTAPTVAGKWSLASDASSDGPSTLEIKLDGTKVTGSIAGPSGTYVVTGSYTEGKLAFTMDYQGQLTVAFTGKLLEDGSLAGTMDYGQGPVKWKAVRVKDTTRARPSTGRANG